MSTMRWRSMLVVVAGTLASAGWARADGVVLRAVDLGPSRSRIEARIAAERQRHPDLFEMVGELSRAPGRGSRSQRPAAVGVTLRRIAGEARWAIAELVAVNGPARARVGDTAWRALQIAAVDALGLPADPELSPILRAAFERSPESSVQVAAAVGMGRLGAAEVPALLAHAVPGDARFAAAVQGLGMSRRPSAVERLARLLDDAPAVGDAEQGRQIAAALAEAGSSWAWSSGGVGTPEEGDAVRRTAAQALVRNYTRLPEATAGDLEAAIRRIDHPAIRSMVSAVRATTPPALLPRLDRLARP